MEKVERQEKNGSGLTGVQDMTWFQISNPVLSHTNEGTNGICWKPADTSLVIIFGKNRRTRKLTKVKGKATKLQLTVMVVEWMRKMITTF